MNIEGKQRPLGTYIAGNPGMGKSSLIQRMALHDITNGRGVCVIDPTADLVNRLIHWIPRSRLKDLVYFDTDYPIPVDFFSYSTNEREVLTDHLVAMFDLEGAPVSKPRLARIFGTLFDANENGGHFTFLDIEPFIKDRAFRDSVTSFCPHRKGQWNDMPPLKDWISVLERLSPFTESRTLRTMFSSGKGLNIGTVMQNKQILLINLKDSPTDLFIGSLLSAKFQQAAFGRRTIPEALRTPYYLYIDECQTILGYAVKSFEAILTRARKYNLCLTLSNQIPSDLPADIRRKVGTLANLILFNLDYQDALIFKHRIIPYLPEDLVDLPRFVAICRTSGHVSRIPTPKFLGPSPASPAHLIRQNAQKLAAQSAQSNQKRSGENSSCDTAPNSFNKGNGNPDPVDSKADTIEGSAPPNVPPYRDQTKGPRKPR